MGYTNSGIVGLGVYRGHQGVRQQFKEWNESFERFWHHADAFLAVGQLVVVRAHQGGRGKSSAVEVDAAPYWQVHEVRGGRVRRVTIYLDEAEALAAAGVQPGTAHWQR